MRVGLRPALIPQHGHPPPHPLTCSLLSCGSHLGGSRDFTSPRSCVPLKHVQDRLQEPEKKNSLKNYFVIHGSFI